MPITGVSSEETPTGPLRTLVRNAWAALQRDVERTAEAVNSAVRHNGRERDLAAQSLKSALAALVAWLVATWLFTDTLSLMAPWVAVVLVQATVYRSVSQGVRQTAAIVIGTALATGTALALGSQFLALILVLPVALLLGNMERFGTQGLTVATSVLFALIGGPVTAQVSAERVGAAVVGAVVGIGVNALIRPPRYLRDAQATLRDATQESAEVLRDIAQVLEDGVPTESAQDCQRRAQHLPRAVEGVRSALEWDRESLRLNVRKRSHEHVLPSDYTTYDVVHTLHQVVDDVRGLAQVIEESTERDNQELALPDWLADAYAQCLRETARAVEAYGLYVTGSDSETRKALTDAVGSAGVGLDRLLARIDIASLPDVGAMEVLGTLLSDTRRLIRSLDAG